MDGGLGRPFSAKHLSHYSEGKYCQSYFMTESELAHFCTVVYWICDIGIKLQEKVILSVGGQEWMVVGAIHSQPNTSHTDLR